MEELSEAQLNRILAKLYSRMQSGHGASAWDVPTLMAVHPGICNSIKRVVRELNRRALLRNDHDHETQVC